MKERLQKILSARGICSRRKAEEYIRQGMVKVNGVVAGIGDSADPSLDSIEVDGTVVEDRKEMLYYLMNKPVGVETSNKESAIRDRDSEESTVRDLLPKQLQGKIYPVGRLDKDTSGLLLFTNDGVLAYRLTHPKFYHEKEYEVHVDRPISDGSLQKLEEGLTILGAKTKPTRIVRLSARRFTISLTEGRNRQIRRMCQKVGSPVKHLRRVRIVSLIDDALEEGRVRALSADEVKRLLEEVEIGGIGN